MEVRLKEKYNKEIVGSLSEKLGRKNAMSLPKVVKIVVNCGVGKFKEDKSYVENTIRDLGLITGQKPLAKKAKQLISNFKVREGDTVGVAVTLRGDKMWALLDKLINVSLPRVRDFKGVSRKAFDGSGNYTIGLKEHSIFPEINPNNMDKIRSLEVTIVTTAKTDSECFELLSGFGMPFMKEKEK